VFENRIKLIRATLNDDGQQLELPLGLLGRYPIVLVMMMTCLLAQFEPKLFFSYQYAYSQSCMRLHAGVTSFPRVRCGRIVVLWMGCRTAQEHTLGSR